MRAKTRAVFAFAAISAALAATPADSQQRGKYLAPADQVIAIRAGRLFDLAENYGTRHPPCAFLNVVARVS